MMPRTLEPEWLDELPAADPRAVRSRRELVFVNWLMGNAGAVARALALREGARIADLGSGDATFTARVARKLRLRNVELALIDRGCPAAPAALGTFAALGWRVSECAADAVEWLRAQRGRLDAVTANLFLHHLDNARLRELLALAAERTRLFVACEPRRSRLALWGSNALILIGCGAVTRHDAVVSVKAGFSGRELSEHWPVASGWRLVERASGPFSHLFVARRDA
jgi:hypothetical protein